MQYKMYSSKMVIYSISIVMEYYVDIKIMQTKLTEMLMLSCVLNKA